MEISVVLVVVASGGIQYLHGPVSRPTFGKGFQTLWVTVSMRVYKEDTLPFS